MALYVYQVVEADGTEGEVFEVMQKMSEPALTVHPENGKPVVRLIAAPNTVTRFGAGNLRNERLGSSASQVREGRRTAAGSGRIIKR